MKKALIIVVVILVILALLAGAGAAYLNGISFTHKRIEYADKYRSDEFGDCVYFTDADFGEYESLSFAVKDKKGLFRSVGSVFTVTYTDEQYSKQMEKINAMEFLDDADLPMSVPSAEIEQNGWIVRILKNAGSDNFPKEFAMIASNDEKKTIAYMYFNDPDLDFIGENSSKEEFINFIEKNFDFKFN